MAPQPATARAAAVVRAMPVGILLVPPRAEAAGDTLVAGHVAAVAITPPRAIAQIPAVATARPLPPVRITISMVRRAGAHPHAFRSSLGGAATALVQRTDSTHPVQEYDSQGPTNSDVIAAEPVLWLDLLVSNSGVNNLYVMVFDAPTVPPDGTKPIRQPLELGYGHQIFVDVGVLGADGISGRPTQQGLCWAASTTPATLTQDTSSSIWATAHYIPLGS